MEIASAQSLTLPVANDASVGSQMARMSARIALSKNFVKEIVGKKTETPLKWVDVKDIQSNETINSKASYLYWACFRGHVSLVKWILEHDMISPFARIYDGRSPLMASLIGKGPKTESLNDASRAEMEVGALVTNVAQVELCSRKYVYEQDEILLEN
jgi:hypothetical protein